MLALWQWGLLSLLSSLTLVACTSNTSSSPTIVLFTASPSNLPAGGGNVTLRLEVDPGVGVVSGSSVMVKVVGSTTFTLTASNASGQTKATAQVMVATPGGKISVKGQVLDDAGKPAVQTRVLLNSSASQLTDAQGRFSFSDVTPPYSLAFNTRFGITEYRGLTRPDPVLALPERGLYGATVRGKVIGGKLENPGDAVFIGASNQVGLFDTSVNGEGLYLAKPTWTGNSPSKTTDLAALKVKLGEVGGNRAISEYVQAGKLTGLTLLDGGTPSGVDITLNQNVPSATSTLSLSLGAYTDPKAYLNRVRVGDAVFPLGFAFRLQNNSSFVLPTSGASVRVDATEASRSGVSIIAAATPNGTTTVKLPDAVLRTVLPANNAKGVGNMPTLSWTPIASADLYQVSLSSLSFADGMEREVDIELFVPAGSQSVQLGDFTALNGTLSGRVDWWVTAYDLGVGVSPDQLTDPGGQGVDLSQLEGALYFSSRARFQVEP